MAECSFMMLVGGLVLVAFLLSGAAISFVWEKARSFFKIPRYSKTSDFMGVGITFAAIAIAIITYVSLTSYVPKVITITKCDGSSKVVACR